MRKNGDVISIITHWGESYGSYTYDAWGNVISQSGNIASINPIRYRGYYYDSETGLYYLGSRYYDPAVKRFINADGATFVTVNPYSDGLTDKWRRQYPSCVKSWEENWEVLSTFFDYPPEIRKIIYTTNIIEGLNRQFRQITKNKPSFTNDDSLRKMLYLASQRIVRHWHARCQNWDMVLSQLEIMFPERTAG